METEDEPHHRHGFYIWGRDRDRVFAHYSCNGFSKLEDNGEEGNGDVDIRKFLDEIFGDDDTINIVVLGKHRQGSPEYGVCIYTRNNPYSVMKGKEIYRAIKNNINSDNYNLAAITEEIRRSNGDEDNSWVKVSEIRGKCLPLEVAKEDTASELMKTWITESYRKCYSDAGKIKPYGSVQKT